MTSARGIAAVSAAIFACLLPVAASAAAAAAAAAAAQRVRPCGAAARSAALAGGGRRHRHRHHHSRAYHHHPRHRRRHHRGGASAGACSTPRSTAPLVRRAKGGGRGFFTPVLLPARIASAVSPPSDGGSPQPVALPKSSHGAPGAGAPEGGAPEEGPAAGGDPSEVAGPGGVEGGAGTPGEPPAAEEQPAEEVPAPPTEEVPAPPTEEVPAPPAEEMPVPPAEEAPAPPVEEAPAPPSGESNPPTEEGGAAGAGESSEPFRFFSPTSFWNRELTADAAIDPDSAAIVGALAGEVAHEEEIKKGPAINTTAWSVPVYTVPADQPTVKVTLPYASTNPTLQSAWEAVPLPADAKPASGTDKHLVVWQPSSDKLWEFWRLEQKAPGWEAYWGGAIQNASSATGAYELQSWPGAKTSWGASASSLSIAGGLITLEDLEKGTINHALAIAVPDTRAKVFAAPAQRTDGGSSEATSLPEGAHLRLNPYLDLAALHLPHFTLMLAEAAQKYGIVVRDTAANVALYAQDPTPTGLNPYIGKSGFYEGKSPAALLAVFPWSELQLLKMELHP